MKTQNLVQRYEDAQRGNINIEKMAEELYDHLTRSKGSVMAVINDKKKFCHTFISHNTLSLECRILDHEKAKQDIVFLETKEQALSKVQQALKLTNGFWY